MNSGKKTVLAAGTVPWRRTKKGNIKVLLISRHKHQDRSFPKGKLDKGESMPAAAVRETLEEVNLNLALGANLGTINYVLGNGEQKTVQYWAAKVPRELSKRYVFTPNDEVQSVHWVRLKRVRKQLTYPADRELFDVFERMVTEDAIDTYAVTLLRHAKAAPRDAKNRVDHLRELTAEGTQQSGAITHTLAAFGPQLIVSSSATRCRQTVAPLANFLKQDLREDPAISQDVWDSGETQDLRDLVANIVETGHNVVLCSHRPVLPDLARELAAATTSQPGRYLREAAELPTGAFSVFHIAKNNPDRGIVSVELYPVRL